MQTQRNDEDDDIQAQRVKKASLLQTRMKSVVANDDPSGALDLCKDIVDAQFQVIAPVLSGPPRPMKARFMGACRFAACAHTNKMCNAGEEIVHWPGHGPWHLDCWDLDKSRPGTVIGTIPRTVPTAAQDEAPAPPRHYTLAPPKPARRGIDQQPIWDLYDAVGARCDAKQRKEYERVIELTTVHLWMDEHHVAEKTMSWVFSNWWHQRRVDMGLSVVEKVTVTKAPPTEPAPHAPVEPVAEAAPVVEEAQPDPPPPPPEPPVVHISWWRRLLLQWLQP